LKRKNLFRLNQPKPNLQIFDGFALVANNRTGSAVTLALWLAESLRSFCFGNNARLKYSAIKTSQ
jgi:hypothetical protein